MDYACPVFYNSLPKYFGTNFERIQKRAMHCILPDLSYPAALTEATIIYVDEHTLCG